MEEKSKKVSLIFVLFMLSLIIILVMGFFIYKLSSEKSEEIKKSSELESQINSLNQKISNLQEENSKSDKKEKTSKSDSEDKDINYIEFNEKNYKKYSPSSIDSITNNNDGTYTIISRVYEEVELPDLSKEEVDILNSGKSIDFLSWNLKKSTTETEESDDVFVIESTVKNDWMKFYVEQNEDGTAKVNVYTQILIVKPTHTYLKAVVDESVLGEDVEEWEKTSSSNKEYTYITPGEVSIKFEDGKISSFEWTGI